MVDPDLNRNGLGHQLVDHCLSLWYDQARGPITLFASQMGYPVYASFGPIVATSVDVATSLVIVIANATPNQDLRLDISAMQSAFAAALREMGFQQTRDPSPVMSLGARALPGDRSCYFAIADSALG